MNYTKRQEQLEFVRAQCKSIPNAKHHQDYTMICCPFHPDGNPSGRINHSSTTRSPGYFKCYGCGATANWDTLAPLLGLQPFNNKPSVRYVEPRIIEDFDDSKEQLEYSDLPRNKRWRTLPTNLLIDCGCKVCRIKYDNKVGSTKYVYMPVLVDNELKGYIKARLKKEEGKPSYINLKGSWVLKYGLFPFDYAIAKMTGTKTIVLVEGQRDALRLLNLGIPALCIMGTQNWSDDKARLLEFYGCERVVIMMDGDDAGIEGTKKVYRSVKKFLLTKVIKLWDIRGSPYIKYKDCDSPSKQAKLDGVELWDPGNCPLEILQKLKSRYIGAD